MPLPSRPGRDSNSRMVLLWVCLACWALCLTQAQELVVFGDSLSDGGLGQYSFAWKVQRTLDTDDVSPAPPYVNGYWSNGPPWVVVAANQLGIPLQDYAQGGGTAATAPGFVNPLQPGFGNLTTATLVLPDNLFQQVATYLGTNSGDGTNAVDGANTTFVILIGANDYFQAFNGYVNNGTAAEVVANIGRVMTQLYNAGGRRFILATVPDVSTLDPPLLDHPQLYGQIWVDLKGYIEDMFNEHNILLPELVQDFTNQYPDASVDIFDLSGALVSIRDNAAANGFNNTVDACFAKPVSGSGGTVCPDPADHIFWDFLHPTAATHALLGQAFAQAFPLSYYLEPNSVPPLSSASARSVAG